MGPKFKDQWPIIRPCEDTQGRCPCANGGRDWSELASSQGTPRTAGNYQKLEEAGGVLSQSSQREHGTLILDIESPDTE